MAKLYEIEQEILSCIDLETGEVLDEERLNQLQMERDSKIESIALWIKNLQSDADAYKAEKDSFAEKERLAKNKIEQLKNWLSYATGQQKFQTTKVQISFRKSEVVEIQDEAAFITYAQQKNRDDLLTYKEPAINKTAIKTAIKDGQEIDFCSIIEKQNIQIK